MEQWLLPVALLAMRFLLKLFIDREVSFTEFIEATLALPLNILFLSTSLITSLIIIDTANLEYGIAVFVIFVAVSALSVFLWRRSDRVFSQDKKKTTGALFMVNLLFATFAFSYTLSLLGEGSLR